MEPFVYRGNQLYAEDVPLVVLAERYGTPLYVYSRGSIEANWRAFDQALQDIPHMICYAVKANANLGVLSILARLGSGFDIVSLGELERVLAAGGDPHKVVFSGVGKRDEEMQRALEVGIYCFNVESEAELHQLNRVAQRLQRRAPVSLRVNPDVDAKTHPYIATGLKQNKFGIPIEDAAKIYTLAATLPHLQITGIDCHIGSQLTEVTPFLDASKRVLKLVEQLRAANIVVEHLDLGGGLGIRYQHETPPSQHEYIQALRSALPKQSYKVLIEPGRAIVANAGILLSKVELLKHTPHKHFAVIDAAMNDLIRPALYDAWHDIVPVVSKPGVTPTGVYDVVGPICETGDFLGKDRSLAIQAGDLLAIRSAGAYGSSMSSNYNSRPRAAEVIVDGAQAHLVRNRETIAQLFQGESPLPE